MARKYGKITFPDAGLDITFGDFKESFGSSEDFNNVPEKNREAGLKKAYEIATKKDGNVSGTAKKGTEDSAKKTD